MLRKNERMGAMCQALTQGAIVAFRGRIQSLWDSIASAINGL